jgi:nicotinate-nucleotide adenylyltransferase
MILKLPPHTRNLRIGLLGGSFNPAHAGHRLISTIALKRLKLDYVWWIVTPGNPLKDNRALPSQDTRMVEAQKIANHPRIKITGFESQIQTRYTYDTIMYLKRHCKNVNFVWLMGADNLSQFHRWQNWREIANEMPIAVIDRPNSTLRSMHSQAALNLQKYRVKESKAPILAKLKAPAWVFLHEQRSSLSSTILRKGKGI